MGMFKSMRQLQKQAKEIDKTFDPGKQMTDATAKMAAAQQMMAEQTKAANISATGIDATAVVSAVRQPGTMINMQMVLEIDLTVMPDGLPPYPLTVSQMFPMVNMGSIQPGANLHVKIDPNDPSSIWIDPARLA